MITETRKAGRKAEPMKADESKRFSMEIAVAVCGINHHQETMSIKSRICVDYKNELIRRKNSAIRKTN
jgi:hypothetical protein